MIYPAPVLVTKLIKKQDIVVVFTDGEIFDIDKPETQQLLQRIGRKSTKATTNLENKSSFTWTKIKMEHFEIERAGKSPPFLSSDIYNFS